MKSLMIILAKTASLILIVAEVTWLLSAALAPAPQGYGHSYPGIFQLVALCFAVFMAGKALINAKM